MGWRPTRLEVNLSAIRANYRAIQKHIGEGKRIFGVVKGDAYGLGAIPVAKTLTEEGTDFFAVATCDEAIELREKGILTPVLVLGPSPYEVAEEYVRLGIRATVNDMEIAEALSRASVKIGKPAYGHLKVDTGMGRIGFYPEEAPDVMDKMARLSGLEMEGIFTHFAIADAEDLSYTMEQYSKFAHVLEEIEKKGHKIRIRHCCNSGATLALPHLAMDGVRPGQLEVGMYPSKEVVKSIPLEHTFEFKTAISALRVVPPDRGVSYGLTYYTRGYEKLAVLPVGYHDGYSRELSGKGAEVLIRGERCPVVGRVCMDQTMVNVTHLEEVEVGDEVVLIGRQGEEYISAEDVADWIGTIVTTIPNMIGKRVTRVYLS